jgi:nucleotide-binding universal stress UspA family protein
MGLWPETFVMTYASILVHVQAGDEGRSRLACASALARSFDATLIGLAAEMIPPLMPEDGISPAVAGWFEIMRESVEENLESARNTFDAASAGLAKPTIWESGIRMPTRAMAGASRGADLIVTSPAPGRRDDSYRHASAAELVITSGRPVLITPSKGKEFVGARAILAWKDTREARRAMTDALPFFKRAQEVLVVELCGQDDERDAKLRTHDVASALQRHGVSASSKAVHGAADSQQILQQASEFGADLIVAGGYGHSRMGEWVFGGVTRDLLAQDKHHVLLSH